MAKEPNRLLRVIVPLVVFVVCGGIIFYSVMRNSTAKPAPAPVVDAAKPDAAKPIASTTPPATVPATTTPTTTPPTPSATAAGVPAPTTPSMSAAPAAPVPTPPPGTTYSAKTYAYTGYDPIGSVTPKDKGGTFELEVRFSPVGAGIERLALANHFEDVAKTTPEVLQFFRPVRGEPLGTRRGLAAFAAEKVELNEQPVLLWLTPDEKTTFWKQVSPGKFEATIVDGSGAEVLKVTRTWELKPGSYEVALHQEIEVPSGGAAANVRWSQFGPVSPPVGAMRYGGDARRVRFGFMLPSTIGQAQTVTANDRAASFMTHPDAIGTKAGDVPNAVIPRWNVKTLWPNADSTGSKLVLSWTAMTNRYYTVAMYPLAAANPAAQPGMDRPFTLAEKVDRLAIPTADATWEKTYADVALRLTTPVLKPEPGKPADVSMGIYAGPTSPHVIDTQPTAFGAGLAQIVIYTFGGPCSFCTFQIVSQTLHDVLEFLQGHVVFDWAISIMLLVVCVRTILHPVTRWSQRRMYFVSKEMAKIAPKMKLIQDKYKDDPVKLREEQGRMMAEHSGAYMGMALGCIPAFLQTPVWIGLSAMIGFAFELHHQPAFFGIFQRISPSWTFLSDLSAPDRFIPLPAFNIPLLSGFLGTIDGINLLPLVLGVVFFIQQKYLQPPQATTMTPEQEQQQKIMKVMTVVMFPLMMYNAPAGLALYFTTNSTLGIIESKWIRRKAEEEYKEIEAVKAAKMATRASGVGGSMWDRKEKIGKPQGFMAKLRAMAEEAQKQRELAAKRKKK